MVARVAVVVVLLGLGGFAGLLLADWIPYARPATSFDTVFSRLGNAVLGGALLGLVLGVALASWIGRGRPEAWLRWGLSTLAAAVGLVVWCAFLAML